MNPERRAWPRAELRLKVWVLADGHQPTAYTARNLSAGGLLLVGGPAQQPARDLKLMMPLSGRDLVLHARVLRCEPDAQGQPCAALALRGVPTFVQDLIQSHVLGAGAVRIEPSVAADQGSAPLR